MDVMIETLISEEEIDRRIREMAEELSRIYEGKELKLVGILKGSVFFMSELAKRLSIPVTLDFIAVSSYGNGTEPGAELLLSKDMDDPVEGQNILLVEDILDTGRTLKKVIELMSSRNPASLAVVTLLDKPSRHIAEVELLMTGFTIPDKFVVGYGLDYAQNYRNLPYIGVIE